MPDEAASPLPAARAEELIEALAVPGLGPVTVRRLLRRFGSWSAVCRADAEALRVAGLKREAVDAVRHREFQDEAREELARAQALGVRLLALGAPEFPVALTHHDDLPPLLYARGEVQERDALAIAIVGSRRSSLYGRMHAERFAFELAQAGFTIVSGLAQGIDAAAHEGALKAGGRTLAVLGSGLGRIYPPENRDLAERITPHGALLSELPVDTAPSAAHFPPRNRIIAGLALGVLVIEANRASGALITARLGGEMGKAVFALPGDIGRPQTRGTHRLIRDGATLVESVEDILEELGPLDRPVQVAEHEPAIPDPRALVLNPMERAVYDLLDGTPRDIDTLTRDAHLSPANVASTLLVLELRRLACQMPGKQYVRAGSFQRPIER